MVSYHAVSRSTLRRHEDQRMVRLDICEAIPSDPSRSISDLVSIIDQSQKLVNEKGYSAVSAVEEVTKKPAIRKKEKWNQSL